MAIVKDILAGKYTQVWYVTPSSSTRDALRLLAEKNIGAVLVMDAGNIAGIFSERDFARKAAQGSITLDTPVCELMVQDVYFATPDQSIESCMKVMSAKHFRHLPVLDQGKLVGVISVGDVIKQLLLEKDVAIKNLEEFIWDQLIQP